ncbi:hypothetical protein [Cohnella silvisoli]|uniref:DUF3990 domain-containing protein n=1 Tax=Cohnella silvisoli TaxID=2873699 RepID=A0ABV1KNA4_9BACL|nr:hypothetical protein [Cohnella silvisoli]MCD9020242.1 hypothetical protein [Cohnella silvisoli]
MILTLFHGNTQSAIDEMVNARQLLEKFRSTGDSHYLGDGFYFYNDPIQAEVWAKMKVNRNPKYFGENWAVMKCDIKVEEDRFLDLDNREEQDFFFSEMIRLYEQLETRNLELMEYNDAYLCNHIASITEVQLISKTFPYLDREEAFPSKFSNDKVPPYSITRHFRTEKQYVVRHSNLISSYVIIKSGKSRIRKRGVAR